MSAAGQILSAKIAAVARRNTRRGVIEDLDSAVAELPEVAGERADLLAEHAGLALGRAEAVDDTIAPQYRAEAELYVAAGADPAKLGPWIGVGRQRAEAAKQIPYTGGL